MKKERIAIFFGIAALSLGTTFIVKENGAEVGRWEEVDGKDVEQVIDNSKREAPKPLDDTPVYGGEAARAAPPKAPAGAIAQWTVSGKLIDIVTLKRLPTGGKVIFTGAGGTFPAKVLEGAFSAKLPALKTGTYTITVELPAGYENRVHGLQGGSFSSLPYPERLRMRQSVSFNSGDQINGNTYEMEIGLFTAVPTAKEKEDYQQFILGPNAAPPGQ